MRYWVFTEEQLSTALKQFLDLEIGRSLGTDDVDLLTDQVPRFLNSPQGQKLMPGHCRDNQAGQGGE